MYQNFDLTVIVQVLTLAFLCKNLDYKPQSINHVDADITVQNENESVWAIITLKYLSKLVVGSFYRPPDRGIQPLLDLEIELAQISEKIRNNPKTTLILGGDFNAGGINWDLCTVDHDATNRPLKEKLISILDEAGLKQIQREPTRGQNLLDLFCCNKPSLIKSINSIPGISDHNIVLAHCKLKPSIITKPQRKIYISGLKQIGAQ